MKYFVLFIPLFIFIGCNNKPKEKIYIKDVVSEDMISNNTTSNNKNFLIDSNLTFYTYNNQITYDFNNSKILLFKDNSEDSKLQIQALKKLNLKYHIITTPILIKYFKINKYPTIIITKDNNNTKKYEGFIPSEILKYEIKD